MLKEAVRGARDMLLNEVVTYARDMLKEADRDAGDMLK